MIRHPFMTRTKDQVLSAGEWLTRRGVRGGKGSLWVVLSVGLLLSGLGSWQAAKRQEDGEKREFKYLCDRARESVRSSIHSYEQSLRSVRGLYIINPNQMPGNFERYVASRAIEQHYPGLLGVGYVERINGATDSRDAQTSAQNKSRFVVREFQPSGRGPITPGTELDANVAWRPAVEHATDSGAVSFITPISLSSSDESDACLAFFLPVYAGGVEPTTSEARIRACTGWVFNAINLKTVTENAGRRTDDRLRVELYEGSSATPEFPVDQSVLRATVPVTVEGRVWTLVATATPAFYTGWPVAALWIGLGGAATTLSLGLLLWTVDRAERRQSKVAERLTRELRDTSVRSAEAHSRLQAILDHATSLIYVKDCDLRFTMVNKAFQNTFRLGSRDIVHLTNRSLFDDRQASRASATDYEVLRTARPLEMEVELPTPDGVRTYLEVKFPIFDECGRVVAVCGIASDITGRKKAEEALRLSKEQAEQTVRDNEWYYEALDETAIIAITDARGRITHASSGFCRISGYARDELVGQDHRIINSGHHDKAFFSHMYREITSGKQWHDAIRNRAKDGSYYWVDTTIIPFPGPDGRPCRYMAIRLDITAQKRVEESLQMANDDLTEVLRQQSDLFAAAEAANQAKSAFLANMSHEIRTPMAAILGFAELMLQPTLSRVDRDNALHAIRRNGSHLLELINDILDLSKIEAGKMTLECIDVDVAKLASEVISMTRSRAMEKNLTLQLRFTTPVPRTIRTDPLRLREILVNLVSNAVKFTEAGTVSMSVSYDGPSDTGVAAGTAEGKLRFDVQDTGIGLTEEQISKLFRPFSQADESTTRRFGGSGLGLTISRRLAEMLNGRVLVASKPKVGSTFTVELSIGKVNARDLVQGVTETVLASGHVKHAELLAQDVLKDVRILLAEDGTDNRLILTAYLQGAGADVETVENGNDAVERTLAAIGEGKAFAVVLMDMQMPKLDGYGATIELRRRGYMGQIVALTAHAMVDDREKCIRLGCDGYLSKPVDRVKLVSTIREHVERGAFTSRAGMRPLANRLANHPRISGVLAQFVMRLPRIAAEMTDLARRDCIDELAEAAHRLKGAGAIYELPKISAAAEQLEEAALRGTTKDEIDAALDRLLGVLSRVEGSDSAAEISAAEQNRTQAA